MSWELNDTWIRQERSYEAMSDEIDKLNTEMLAVGNELVEATSTLLARIMDHSIEIQRDARPVWDAMSAVFGPRDTFLTTARQCKVILTPLTVDMINWDEKKLFEVANLYGHAGIAAACGVRSTGPGIGNNATDGALCWEYQASDLQVYSYKGGVYDFAYDHMFVPEGFKFTKWCLRKKFNAKEVE